MAWLSAPATVRPPGGETLEEARARVSPALAALHRRHPDETVVLVTHSIVGRIVIADCLGAGLSVVAHLKLKTASISVLRLDTTGGVLERLGDVSHLKNIPATVKRSSASTQRLEDQSNFCGIQEGEEPRWQTSVSSAARATSV